MFYKLWHDAELGRNEYTTTEVHWSQVPGRDEKWKEQTIANTSERQFTQEFECEFLGSVDTLISAAKLRSMSYDEPLHTSGGLKIYERPQEKHEYLMTVDVSRGVNNDYSAFILYDITTVPYKIVGIYRNNEVKPMVFPNIINQISVQYNQAYVLCEVNDIGDQVASILQYDLENENVLMCAMRGRAGQVVGQGFSGTKTQLGVKMSTTVKKIGCSNLKQLVETDKVLINDYDIIAELTTFIQKRQSFEADDGCHDDLAMCLVIFGWLVAQDYFKEMTENDVRTRIYEEQKNQIEQDMAPFGFIDDGLGTYEKEKDQEGNVWVVADNKGWYENESPRDEYGELNYMWEYR